LLFSKCTKLSDYLHKVAQTTAFFAFLSKNEHKMEAMIRVRVVGASISRPSAVPSFVGEGSPLPKSAKIEDGIRFLGIAGGETPPLRPDKTHR
jgi:hypothetical protein